MNKTIILTILSVFLAHQSFALQLATSPEFDALYKRGFCEHVDTKFNLLFEVVPGHPNVPGNISFTRLCSSSRLIDLSIVDQNITISKVVDNSTYFPDPNYGDKFRMTFKGETTMVTIVPMIANMSGSEMALYHMYPANIKIQNDPVFHVNHDKKQFVSARLVPRPFSALNSEIVQLHPGWVGGLPAGKIIEQTLVPGPNSTYTEETVKVELGWQLLHDEEGVRADVIVNQRLQKVTILFNKH